MLYPVWGSHLPQDLFDVLYVLSRCSKLDRREEAEETYTITSPRIVFNSESDFPASLPFEGPSSAIGAVLHATSSSTTTADAAFAVA